MNKVLILTGTILFVTSCNCYYDQNLRRSIYDKCMERSMNLTDTHIERSRVNESCLEAANKLHYVCPERREEY